MHITIPKNPPPTPTLFIDGVPLSVTSKVIVLGLAVQQDLRWSSQVDTMSTRTSRKLFLLKYIKRLYVTTADLQSIYTEYNKH